MRISVWSSDVCSSDLNAMLGFGGEVELQCLARIDLAVGARKDELLVDPAALTYRDGVKIAVLCAAPQAHVLDREAQWDRARPDLAEHAISIGEEAQAVVRGFGHDRERDRLPAEHETGTRIDPRGFTGRRDPGSRAVEPID